MDEADWRTLGTGDEAGVEGPTSTAAVARLPLQRNLDAGGSLLLPRQLLHRSRARCPWSNRTTRYSPCLSSLPRQSAQAREVTSAVGNRLCGRLSVFCVVLSGLVVMAGVDARLVWSARY